MSVRLTQDYFKLGSDWLLVPWSEMTEGVCVPRVRLPRVPTCVLCPWIQHETTTGTEATFLVPYLCPFDTLHRLIPAASFGSDAHVSLCLS